MTKIELMKKLNQSRADKVPQGYKTAQQLGKMWKMTPSGLGPLLRRALVAGIAEKKDFTIESGGYLRKVPHYRFKEKK